MDNPGKTSFRGKFYFKIERKMLMIEEKEGHIKIKVLYPKTNLLPKTALPGLFIHCPLIISRNTFQAFCVTS